jgi:hypothetical protein
MIATLEEGKNISFLPAGSGRPMAHAGIPRENKSHFHFNDIQKQKRDFHNLLMIPKNPF